MRNLPTATRWTPGTGGCATSGRRRHILGFAGPKAEAGQIKAKLATFLRETLALELNRPRP